MATPTSDQRSQFARDGYVVIRDFAPPANVEQALRLINSWFVRGFETQDLATYHAQSFAPQHTGAPEVLDLLGDNGLAFAEQLVGAPLIRPDRAQIALRFPVPPGESPLRFGAHIDGVPTPDNGVPADGLIYHFTLLAGVLLSDVTGDEQGQLVVWPGTHHAMAAWFARHEPRAPEPSAFFQATAELADATAEPTTITGRAGDLVLAHYLLLHAVGPHRGPSIRYAVFYRLMSERHAALGDNALTSTWAGWPAMQAHRRPDQLR